MATLREDVKRRLSSPGTVPPAPEALPDSAPPPAAPISDDRPKGGFMGGVSNVLEGFAQDLIAAQQGTSPIVRTLTGESSYERLGKFVQTDGNNMIFRPDGSWVDFDADKHVALIDPDTGKLTAYARTKETDERLSALARILSFGALANPVSRLAGGPGINPRPNDMAGLVQKFDSVGVNPTLPAVTDNRSIQNTATGLLESIPGGDVLEGGTRRATEQTGAAAERIAAQSGTTATKQGGGEAAIRGAQRFVGVVSDDISLPDDAITTIIKTPTRKLSTDAGEGFLLKAKALYQRADSFFEATDTVPLQSATEALTGTSKKFSLEALGKEFVSPVFQRWAKIIEDNGGALSFADLKLFRTEVGRMLRSPQKLMQADIDSDALKRLYGALSDDVLTFAATKGDDAVSAVREADKFYRAGAERIRGALKSLLAPDAAGEATFDLLVKKAGERGGANLKQLQAIRKSIPDDEWNEVTASVIREIGRPTASATDRLNDTDFSISSFLTNYERMSDGGKDILFGGAGRESLRKEMDTLADVVAAQRRTQRLLNHSGTGRVFMTGALVGLASLDFVTGVATAGGAWLAASLMVNPKFVRWLATSPTTALGSQAWASHAAKLRVLAGQDESIQPAATALLSRLEAQGLGTDTEGLRQSVKTRLEKARTQ